jgi:iron complex transport system substrate-binding protein
MQRFLSFKLRLSTIQYCSLIFGALLFLIPFTTQAATKATAVDIATCKKWFPPPFKQQFAGGFTISIRSSYKFVTVVNINNPAEKRYYLLKSKRGLKKHPELLPQACLKLNSILVPVKRVVAHSTTHLATIEQLGEGRSVKGFSNLALITSSSLLDAVSKKQLVDVLFPPNPERVITLNPDLVMVYIARSAQMEGVAALERQHLPVVVNQDYREQSALARAEWIKFVAVFYDKEDLAQQIFKQIVDRYQALVIKARGAASRSRPVVLLGSNRHGVWSAPGLNSDLVQMVRDAGGRYLFSDIATKGKEHRVSLRHEQVLSRLAAVNFWFPHNGWKTEQDLWSEDRRYQRMDGLKSVAIYNNNRQLNSQGGNNYWEMAVMRPDLLLMDLIRMIHPAILPDHKLHWYHPLKLAR